MQSKLYKGFAAAAWCPDPRHGSLLAASTCEGILNENFQTSSTLHILDTRRVAASAEKVSIGAIQCPANVASLSWASGEELIAGGLGDGAVVLWRAELAAAAAELAEVGSTDGGFVATSLDFSSGEQAQLAAAGASFQINVFDVKGLELGTSLTSKLAAQVTALRWSPKVPYIIAAGNKDGRTIVWDLRQNKEAIHLNCSMTQSGSNTIVSDITWNPYKALQLAVAYGSLEGDLWDLRNAQKSTARLNCGTSAVGPVAVDWSPHASRNGSVSFFSGDGHLLQSSAAYAGPLGAIRWAPARPAAYAAQALDAAIAVRDAFFTGEDHAPIWLGRRASSTFNAAGELLAAARGSVTVKRVIATQLDPQLYAGSNLERALDTADMGAFCREMATGEGKDSPWGYIAAMFASDKKAEFLQILGYECAISAELASTGEEGGANHRAGDGELSPVDETTFFDTIASVEDDESIFIEKMTKHPGVKADDEGDVKTCEEGGDEMAAEDDVEVERNLISGDFDRAVASCLKSGKFSDALLIASSRPELWERTSKAYLAQHKTRFMAAVMPLIIDGRFDRVAAESDLAQWRQSLALLISHAERDSLSKLCGSLGDRLDRASEKKSALVCYVVGGDVGKAVASIISAGERDHASLERAGEMAFALACAAASGFDDAAVQELLARYAMVLRARGSTALADRLVKRLAANVRSIKSANLREVLPLGPSTHKKPNGAVVLSSEKSESLAMPGPTTNPTQPVGNRHNRSQHKISVPEKQRNPPPGLPEKPLARPAPKSGPKNEQQSSAPVQQPKPAAGFSIDSLRSLSGKSVEQKEQMPGSVARAQFRQADASVSAQLPGGDAVSTAVAALGGVVQALERRSLSTLERRKLAESSARIGTLQTATGADEERLAALTREVASGSFAAAKQRHAEMAAADKDGRQREWLSAVNTLLLIARRHQGSE